MNGRITTTKSIYKTLTYNEQKVQMGKAECLIAENFMKELPELSREDKLDHFRQRIALNERVVKNTMHIPINFGTGEKISNELMQNIAKRYLERIGYEDQPYIVYRHYDSAHEHFHIVSTSLRADGSLIKISSTALRASQQLFRKLEREFFLLKNEKTKLTEAEKFKVNHANPVVYGQVPIKHSISDVLNTVIDHFKYSNLNELNAVLHQYNVKASRGSEDSRLYQVKGLVYHAIDDRGQRVGKGIKASSFFLKPTLAYLEKKFVLNQSLRQESRQRVSTAIDWTLAGTAPDWPAFKEALEREGIGLVVQEGKKDGEGGVFFIDHQAKAVFEGTGMGTKYSLPSIRERCAQEQDIAQDQILSHRLHHGL
jgi:relaxase-like protein